MHLELQSIQHVELHLQNFGPAELVFAHLKQVLKLGRVDLFILSGNQERSDAQNVQLRLFYLLQTQVPVYQENSHIQCFWHQTELAMYIDDPLD